MEEKYNQIEMNIDTPFSEEKDASKDVLKPTASEKSVVKTRKLSPDTLQISDETAVENDNDDIDLVSPNEAIFKKVTEQLKASAGERADSVAWAHETTKEKSDNDVELDDTYASTAETDRNFMSAFGIDGADKTLNIDEGTNQSTTEIETAQNDIRSDYYEYTDRQQRKEIVGMYKYAKKSIKTKIVMASLFAALIFLVENLSIFGTNLTGVLNIEQYPYLHFFVDFLLFGMCIACAYEQMYHGVRSMFSKEYIPESVAVIAAAAGLLFSIINLILIPFGMTPMLYNLPASFIILMSLVFSYINVVREKYGFSVVSSKDVKFVLTAVSNDDAEPEQDTFSTTSNDFNGRVARIDRTCFVKNFFSNTNSTVDISRYLEVYYAISVILPLVFAVISLFRSFGFQKAIAVWYLGLLLMLPAGILFMYSVPFHLANKGLFEDEVSVIGEAAVEEFADIDVVSVNDTTAFPPYNVKLQNFNTYNDYKLEKVLYYAASGFSVVGGPLSEVFGVATKDAMSKSHRSKFVCSARNCLCVKVDNDTIIFADKYGMTSQGIDVGSEKEENSDVSVMYMACNGKLCAKMYIKYKIDDEFVKIVKYLSKNGISVGIRTFDPNINNELIKKQTELKKADLRTIRLASEDDIPKTYEKADGKIVSKGLSRSLLKAVPMCKKIANTRKAVKAIKYILSTLGAVSLGFLVFGKIPFVTSALIVGVYAVATLIMTLVSLIMLPPMND